jgi:AraC-like DNA-binding protein
LSRAPHGLAAVRAHWQTRRDELHRLHALVDGAQLCDALLGELDTLVRAAANEPLSLREAAAESGYSPDHLARLIRTGELPNAGRPRAPKIRRGDLPAKRRGPAKRLAAPSATSYDLTTDARSLLARRGE